MDNVTNVLVSAIRASVANLSPLDVAGYALIVDADMQSVYGASASRKFIDDNDKSVLFMPVDWPEEYHSVEFSHAGEQFGQLSGAQYELRVGALTNCMALALERSREMESSLERALLLVICADGGGVWDRVEGDVVRRLNGTAAYEQWVNWRGARPPDR